MTSSRPLKPLRPVLTAAFPRSGKTRESVTGQQGLGTQDPSTVHGIGIHVYPAPMVHESRMLRLSGALQRSGLFGEVHLVGTKRRGLPDREHGKDGTVLVRVGGRRRATHLLGKVIASATWQLRVFHRYCRQDLASVSAHNVWVLPLCWLLAATTRSRLVYNTHELETETPSMVGAKQHLARGIEAALVRRCSLVSVVNDSIGDWYSQRYGVQTVTAYNIPLRQPTQMDLRGQLGLGQDTFLYVHTGHLAEGRGIPHVVRTFAGQDRVHVVFIGDGAHGDLVREAARTSANIHWIAPVPPNEVVSCVAQADAALCLIETRALSYRLSSPNKLFEALTASTPVLCSNLAEARRFLGDLADTWIIEDPEAQLAAAVARIGHIEVEAFRRAWQGLRTWDDEVQEVVRGYALALGTPR